MKENRNAKKRKLSQSLSFSILDGLVLFVFMLSGRPKVNEIRDCVNSFTLPFFFIFYLFYYNLYAGQDYIYRRNRNLY
jgi:hypothetical protein